jgi:hypothetical protein
MERFSLKKLNGMEDKEQYHVKIPNWLEALSVWLGNIANGISNFQPMSV